MLFLSFIILLSLSVAAAPAAEPIMTIAAKPNTNRHLAARVILTKRLAMASYLTVCARVGQRHLFTFDAR